MSDKPPDILGYQTPPRAGKSKGSWLVEFLVRTVLIWFVIPIAAGLFGIGGFIVLVLTTMWPPPGGGGRVLAIAGGFMLAAVALVVVIVLAAMRAPRE